MAEAAERDGRPAAAWLLNELGPISAWSLTWPGPGRRSSGRWRSTSGSYGPDHPNVAIRLNNLGRVLQDQGDLAGARAAFERALAIDERVHGPDHPDVATGVNNLGRVLQDQGDLAGARAAFERALAIDERVHGPDHPNVATGVNNLGIVLRDQGDLAGARAAFERALAIDERVHGPDHPNVAIRRQQPGPRAAGPGRPGRGQGGATSGRWRSSAAGWASNIHIPTSSAGRWRPSMPVPRHLGLAPIARENRAPAPTLMCNQWVMGRKPSNCEVSAGRAGVG